MRQRVATAPMHSKTVLLFACSWRGRRLALLYGEGLHRSCGIRKAAQRQRQGHFAAGIYRHDEAGRFGACQPFDELAVQRTLRVAAVVLAARIGERRTSLLVGYDGQAFPDFRAQRHDDLADINVRAGRVGDRDAHDAPFVPPVLPPTITEYSIPRTAKEAPTEIPPTPSNAQGQGDEEAQAALRAFLTDTDSALTSTKTETETLETPEPKESIQ